MTIQQRSHPAELADIALTMYGEPDIRQTIDCVVDYARTATRCDDGGLLLLKGRNHLESAGATGSDVEQSDHLQADLDEGPGPRVVRSQRVAVVDDTSADPRWPRWSERAVALGLRSVLSVPLSTTHSTLGALNLYAKEPRSFDESDVSVAETFAQHASVALASALEEDGLRHAIDSRHLVGQAQGILMERFGLDAEQAFAVLRRYSRDGNVKLRVVAEQIIETRRFPD